MIRFPGQCPAAAGKPCLASHKNARTALPLRLVTRMPQLGALGALGRRTRRDCRPGLLGGNGGICGFPPTAVRGGRETILVVNVWAAGTHRPGEWPCQHS
jgi:hypothetical protein